MGADPIGAKVPRWSPTGLTEPATAERVNQAFETAADGPLKGILRYTTDPVVSHDVIGEPASCLSTPR